MPDINNINPQVNNVINNNGPKIEIEEKENIKVEEVKKIEVPNKEEKRIVQESEEGDTLSISETGENLYNLQEAKKEDESVLVKAPEIDIEMPELSAEENNILPDVKVETPERPILVNEENVNNESGEIDELLNSDNGEGSLSSFTTQKLKRMLDNGEITRSEYDFEIAMRKAEGKLEETEQDMLEKEKVISEIEHGSEGLDVNELINNKYGDQK